MMGLHWITKGLTRRKTGSADRHGQVSVRLREDGRATKATTARQKSPSSLRTARAEARALLCEIPEAVDRGFATRAEDVVLRLLEQIARLQFVLSGGGSHAN